MSPLVEIDIVHVEATQIFISVKFVSVVGYSVVLGLVGYTLILRS